MTEPLSKVDSAVQGLSSSPPKDDVKKVPRRASSTNPDVLNVTELGKSSRDLNPSPVGTDVGPDAG